MSHQSKWVVGQSVFLGVNIDHVATLRNTRGTTYPSILEAGLCACAGGADRITVHLREDRRHIKDADVSDLKDRLKVGLNLELAPRDEMLSIVEKNKPYSVCLVPEKREELTTEGGLDLIKGREQIENFVEKVRKASSNSKISLFIEPDRKTVEIASQIGVDILELHTGEYANSGGESALNKIKEAAELGRSMNITIHAGHGLHKDNVAPISKIKDISELNIGHSLISDAVFHGLKEAVRRMKELIN